MKKITRYILPRYWWFMIWFKQWFRNAQGIKGFAAQAMNWLMQYTMALAQNLKNENRRLAESIKMYQSKLATWLTYPVIGADEWDKIRGTVRKIAFWVFIGVVTEAACNYFAIESVMEGKGWFWIALRSLVALGITGLCLYFFERWFGVLINKPNYKETLAKQRNWIEFVALTCLCIGFEIAFYWLCRRRSVVLEGAAGDDTITYFVTIFGMLLPVGAGYLAYERSIYLSAYKNTLRIADAEKRIAKATSTIATNNQKMEDYFKRKTQDSVAILEEYRIYKENYNLKHGIEAENTQGHFCETHDTYEAEAIRRYHKEVLQRAA